MTLGVAVCVQQFVLRCVIVCYSVQQYAAVRCSALQCVAVPCSVLQVHTREYADGQCGSNTQQFSVRTTIRVAVCYRVLKCVSQCVQVCCSALQYAAVCCNVLRVHKTAC